MFFIIAALNLDRYCFLIIFLIGNQKVYLIFLSVICVGFKKSNMVSSRIQQKIEHDSPRNPTKNRT